MKVAREAFYNKLKMVAPGLSAREFLEQSSCFVFREGQIWTFNDEIACHIESGLTIEGAVQSSSLLAILDKLPDDELLVRVAEDGLEFKGKRRGFSVVMEAEVFLPVERVEQPEKWRKLPEGVLQAFGLVQRCVSSDDSQFVLTCVHIHPEWVEACDGQQAMRCNVETRLKRPILIRGASLSQMTNLGMSHFSLTKNWAHFRNEAGLVFSCRRYIEDYPDLEPIIEVAGQAVTIPKGLGEATERAAIFATDKAGDALVRVVLDGKRRRMWIYGEGLSGRFYEAKKVSYEGPRMEFFISPKLLCHVSETYTDAEVSDTKLKVTGAQWVYVTVLGAADEAKDPEDGEEPEDDPSPKKRKQRKRDQAETEDEEEDDVPF